MSRPDKAARAGLKSKGAETRATVMRSGLAGAAAGVVAAAMSSQAGAVALDRFGQAVGMDINISGEFASPEDAEVLIAPFTPSELRSIHARLADSAKAIEVSRAETEDEIAYMREVAARRGVHGVYRRTRAD